MESVSFSQMASGSGRDASVNSRSDKTPCFGFIISWDVKRTEPEFFRCSNYTNNIASQLSYRMVLLRLFICLGSAVRKS